MTVWVQNNSDRQVVVQRTPVMKADQLMSEGTGTDVLISSLRRLLADAVSFYLRAHGYHWNVKGADFAQYHALFEEIYSDTYESVDPIAENIVKLDGVAPFRLPELMALRSLSDNAIGSPLPAVMAADLLEGNAQVLDSLQQAFDVATSANEQGIANFLAERIDSHQKWAWQLKASITGV